FFFCDLLPRRSEGVAEQACFGRGSHLSSLANHAAWFRHDFKTSLTELKHAVWQPRSDSTPGASTVRRTETWECAAWCGSRTSSIVLLPNFWRNPAESSWVTTGNIWLPADSIRMSKPAAI